MGVVGPMECESEAAFDVEFKPGLCDSGRGGCRDRTPMNEPAAIFWLRASFYWFFER